MPDLETLKRAHDKLFAAHGASGGTVKRAPAPLWVPLRTLLSGLEVGDPPPTRRRRKR